MGTILHPNVANLLSSILCAPAFKMGILSRHLRVPRPRTFLYLMSLRTGVEMVSLSVIFNKLTGFFGLLAILTGVSLSPLQLSMYIYSVGALALISENKARSNAWHSHGSTSSIQLSIPPSHPPSP